MKLSRNKNMSHTNTALMNEFFPWRLKNYLRKINVSPEDDGNRYTFKSMIFYRHLSFLVAKELIFRSNDIHV